MRCQYPRQRQFTLSVCGSNWQTASRKYCFVHLFPSIATRSNWITQYRIPSLPLAYILFKLRIRRMGRVRIERNGERTHTHAQTRPQTRNKLGTFTANRFPTDALTIYLVLFYAKSFAMPGIPPLLALSPRLAEYLNWKSCRTEEKYQRGANGFDSAGKWLGKISREIQQATA